MQYQNRFGALLVGAFVFLLSTGVASAQDHASTVYSRYRTVYDTIQAALSQPAEAGALVPVAIDRETFTPAVGPHVDQTRRLLAAIVQNNWAEVGRFSVANFLDTAQKAQDFFGRFNSCVGIAETHVSSSPRGIVMRCVQANRNVLAYTLWWTNEATPRINGALLGGATAADQRIIVAADQRITTEFMRQNAAPFVDRWWTVGPFGERPGQEAALAQLTASLPRPPGVPAAVRNPAVRDISPLLATALTAHNQSAERAVPGIAVAAARLDGPIFAGFAGLRRADRPDLPVASLSEGWHLGSNTKSMTATLFATEIVAAGIATFDITLGEVFPEWRAAMRGGFDRVTIRQILAHRGGFHFMPPSELARQDQAAGQAMAGSPANPNAYQLREAILRAYFQHHAPEYQPGSQQVYSNLGYVVVGHAVEALLARHSGEQITFETLLTSRLFAAIGITRAWVGPPGEPGRNDQPLGHTSAGVPREPPTDNPPYMTPAGRISLTAVDHLQYALFHLQARAGTRPDILPAPIAQDLQGASSVNHDGSNTMWYSRILVDYGQPAAIVMETNSAAGREILQRLTAILNALVGGTW